MRIRITAETPNVIVDHEYDVTGGSFTPSISCRNAGCSSVRLEYTVIGEDQTPAPVPKDNAIEI